MSKAILITRPDHDLITTYLFQWSEAVISLANKKHIKIHLKMHTGNRKKLWPVIFLLCFLLTQLNLKEIPLPIYG